MGTDTFTGTYNTIGGDGYSLEGGAGTLFRDTGTNGELVIDNGGKSGIGTNFVSSGSPYEYDNLVISNGAYMILDPGVSLVLNTYTIGATFEPYGVVTGLSNLIISDGGELLLPTTSTLNFSDIFPTVTD